MKRGTPAQTSRAGLSRRGTTAVELAVVAPIFGIFLAGIVEFGHAYLVINTLNAAAKQSARAGAIDGATTADVVAKAQEVLGASIDPSEATYYVKDASVFDTDPDSVDGLDYAGLPDIEVSTAESTQLYVVRIEVPYDEVALMPPFWAKNLTLVGQSATRHE